MSCFHQSQKECHLNFPGKDFSGMQRPAAGGVSTQGGREGGRGRVEGTVVLLEMLCRNYFLRYEAQIFIILQKNVMFGVTGIMMKSER